jgi:hypothetical protein
MSLLFILEIVLWLGVVYFGFRAIVATVATVLQVHGSFFATNPLTRLNTIVGYKWKRQWFYFT